LDKKVVLSLLLTFFFIFRYANSLAVVQPLPANITLKRGESIPFSFEIQALTSREDQICSYYAEGLKPLQITFKEPEIRVEAGKTRRVFGNVRAPFFALEKEYKGWIIVKCSPIVKIEGASVVNLSFKIPFIVTVTGEGALKSFVWIISSITIVIFLIWKSLKRIKTFLSFRKKLRKHKKFKEKLQILN